MSIAKKVYSPSITPFLKYPVNSIKFSVNNDKKKSSATKIIFYSKVVKKSKQSLIEALPFFKGNEGQWVEQKNEIHIGLGELKKLTSDKLGSLFSKVGKKTCTNYISLELSFPEEFWVEQNDDEIANLICTGFNVASYPVNFLNSNYGKKKNTLKSVAINVPVKSATGFAKSLKYYSVFGRHINAARQVMSLPGNYLTPENMQKRAVEASKLFDLKLTTFGQKELEKLGANGILAVAQGSSREPRMLILEYKPKSIKDNSKLKTLALVGKGVTFDTGGISLKPPSDMHEMKFDMGGAASALHAICAIAEQKLDLHVYAIVGMVENMPGGSAFKPGDVYKSLKGITIEVQNTDAEGRLVLGDLLTYAERNFKADLIVDLATLTGAIMVALGAYYGGSFTPSNNVSKLLNQASQNSGEPLWSMPLDKKFTEQLKSDIADYKNIGGRWGGSSSAASFLSLFLDKPEKWVHLDIAGIGFIKQGFNVYPAHATGYGIRLLGEVARLLIKEK